MFPITWHRLHIHYPKNKLKKVRNNHKLLIFIRLNHEIYFYFADMITLTNFENRISPRVPKPISIDVWIAISKSFFHIFVRCCICICTMAHAAELMSLTTTKYKIFGFIFVLTGFITGFLIKSVWLQRPRTVCHGRTVFKLGFGYMLLRVKIAADKLRCFRVAICT